MKSWHPLIVKNIAWPDEAATAAFAQGLARKPAIRHALIELQGDLGAGKTTFVRHLLHSLGVTGRIKSPTYAVVEPYNLQIEEVTRAGTTGIGTGIGIATDFSAPLTSSPSLKLTLLNVWHFDFYRFNDPDEWEEAGFRDIFSSPGLKLVEWPDKAGEHLPPPDLQVAIEVIENESRHITLTAYTPTGVELLA